MVRNRDGHAIELFEIYSVDFHNDDSATIHLVDSWSFGLSASELDGFIRNRCARGC